MAKFALECPKCGSLNTASTFILSKKVIRCGTCNEEINVANSRMISKQCSKCGKIVVCDQAHLKNKACPVCGEKFSAASATEKYVRGEITCPQCSCQIEIDKSKQQATCPICDAHIDIARELARLKQVSSTGVSVIKYEGDNSTFIWKHPIEDFNLGSQLIVHESQEAVFFLGGQALDTFGPGRHSLETENLPILKKAYNLPTGKQSPFHAEVYFINKTVQMALKWGTDSRVRFIEPNTGIPLDLGASGEMNLQVENGRKLLLKLVGTTGGLSRSQILSAGEGSWNSTLKGYFRPMVMTTVKTHLASTIKAEKLNILEIDEQLEALSSALRQKISAGFEEYGLTVPQFYVTNVSLPEDDKNFKQIRELMAASYLGVRSAEVEAQITAARRKVTLEEETTLTEQARMQAERTRIAALAEADKKRYDGLAQAEVMAAQGYSQRDVLQAEVQKAYAEGLGNMSVSGGGGSGIMSDVLGLGIGMAAMGTMGSHVSDVMKGFTPAGQQAPAGDSGWDCACGNKGNNGKFCAECGAPKPKSWDCACGARGNTGKFCAQCGAPKPESWDCPHCGARGNKGKFCAECGKTREVAATWDCTCGNKGITGKFCSECGKRKED